MMAGGVVLFRPFRLQERLGLSIALLLPPIGGYGIATMMPDDCRRAKSQGPAARLQAPADIDVVACGVELRIEAADGGQGRFAEGHVTAGNVLRDLVGQEDMHGTAGRVRNAIGNESVGGRRN